jgi:hypothetical protein
MYSPQRMNRRTCGRIVLALATACGTLVHAQEKPAPPATSPVSPIAEVTQVSPVAPCLQPPPVANWQDYEGPFPKLVGAFGRKLELKSVNTISGAHYKPGTVLCSLTLGGKFLLFARLTFAPVTFLQVAANAGIGQAQNSTPDFGQGAAGYGKRYGANFADQASSQFFKIVMYPEIFRQDPRYYRLATGSGKQRFFHALKHSVVTHGEDGRNEFNFSEWLGATSAIVLSYTYHPGADTSVGHTVERLVSGVAQDAGYDVLREFWPEIAHKFKLPFREQPQGPVSPTVPAGAHGESPGASPATSSR